MEYIDPNRRYQDRDNYIWVRDAKKNKLVVGTQCRILYQDAMGRMNIALKFNEMVRNGEDRPRDAGPGPPRYRRHGLPLPGDLQHQGWLQHHGRYGGPVLRRQLPPGA